MAKKKTIDLRSVDPTPVPEGDVNIIYNGTRIGGFSEDTEATLKTAGCRVEHDINVNYSKPENNLAGVHVTYNNNTEADVIPNPAYGYAYSIINGQAVSTVENSEYVLPDYTLDEETGKYVYGIGFDIPADNDIYDVSYTGGTAVYDNGYSIIALFEEYPTQFTITITEKQV